MPVGNNTVAVKNNSTCNNDTFFFCKPYFYAVADMGKECEKKRFGIDKQSRIAPAPERILVESIISMDVMLCLCKANGYAVLLCLVEVAF